jgi:hypothetical protein
MLESVKEGHRFGVVRSREANRPTSSVRTTLIKKNIAPSSRAYKAVLINDGRAVSDEHRSEFVWGAVGERCRELSGGSRESINASKESIAKRKPRTRLRQLAERRETRIEPRRINAVMKEFITKKRW